MLCHPSMAVKTKWNETVLLITIYDIMAACVSTSNTHAFSAKQLHFLYNIYTKITSTTKWGHYVKLQ